MGAVGKSGWMILARARVGWWRMIDRNGDRLTMTRVLAAASCYAATRFGNSGSPGHSIVSQTKT